MRLIDADAYAAEMKKRQDACWHLLEEAKKYGGVSFEGIDRLNAIYATFSEAKLTLDDMPTVGDWISVKDRLPENQERVVARLSDTENIVCCFYSPDEWWDIEGMWRLKRPTHWMPVIVGELPEEVKYAWPD